MHRQFRTLEALMETVPKSEIKDILEAVAQEGYEHLNARVPWFEYISFHRVGDSLPRGRIYRQFKVAQSVASLDKYVAGNYAFARLGSLRKRMSNFLIKQLAVYEIATINGLFPLHVDSCFEVVRLLDGYTDVPESIKLIKRNCAFNSDSILGGYEHHHVPIYPNSYAQLHTKPNFQHRIVETWDNRNGKARLSEAEEQLKTSNPGRPGRMTGFWLISKQFNGRNYYLGLFPHGREDRSDDKRIFDICRGAENELGIRSA